MKHLILMVVLSLFSLNIQAADETKAPSPNRVIAVVTINHVYQLMSDEKGNLTLEKGGYRNDIHLKTVKSKDLNVPDKVIEDNARALIKKHMDENEDKVTLGIGSTLGKIVGGAGNVAGTVASVAGGIAPIVEKGAELAAGLLAFI